MKKFFIVLIVSFFSTGIYAQEGFKLGIQAGLPFNDYNEAVSVVLGADFSYMYPLGEVVDVGPAIGYIHGFAETFQTTIIREEQKAVQFMPLSAGVRFGPPIISLLAVMLVMPWVSMMVTKVDFIIDLLWLT